MGKKAKDEVPNLNSIANRDIIQRLNFIYQASVYLNGLPCEPGPPPSQLPASDPPGEASGQAKFRKGWKKRKLTAEDLSKNYVKSMKTVGKKTVVKMDPTVKRTICKGCNTVLVPGSTATIRVKSSSSHSHAVTYTCIACGTFRRIPAPPTLTPSLDTSSPLPASVADNTPTAMSVDQPNQDSFPQAASTSQTRRRKKKAPTPRPLPLFARGVGHITFRGSEKLPDEVGGASFVV